MKIFKTSYIIIALLIGICAVSVFWAMNKNTAEEIFPEQAAEISRSTTTPADINATSQSPATQGEAVDAVEETSKEVAGGDDNYVFDIEADPHMDEQSDSKIYTQTIKNIVSDKPAFLIDLGDIFMVDKLSDKSEANIKARYDLMKGYYDLLGSIPLYFAMGNHDGEVGWDKLYTKNYRLQYFPKETYDKNYYSFEKENALFVVLDPYMYTTTKPNENGWDWTLGKAQYDWLKKTLESSNAKYKFVFIHQLVGGDNQGRGGIEFAKLYEWGGNNIDGSYGFTLNRSGWGTPIHQLLVDNKVDVVFKGHDHFFAKQILNGVIYQTVPQPSHPGANINTAEEYGYLNGVILGGSGYLRVTVMDTKALVEFVKTNSTKDVADSYSIQ